MSTSTPTPETHTFQAEVKQLLDIVIHSLYTDREIFVRELVSNAADSLAKLRHLQLAGEAVHDESLPIEINLSTDDTAGTLTIQDYGIGLTRTELVENLGTIAKSGSRAFAAALKEMKDNPSQTLELIGQFGVGFYSAFMVADEVRVYTHSSKAEGENLCWISDGLGQYRIEATDDTQRRGAKIVIKLKEDAKEFAKEDRIQELLKQYSSFVPYPINLNGKRVNTVEAIWTKKASEVTPEAYTEFYKFQANAFDDPLQTFHFSADAPLAINALLFTPTQNIERFGFGRMEPGVALYCKKVLIDPHPRQLLPEWLRFLRGVIDSADLPLNISRESMQDSALVRKLSKVITGRFIKFLADEAKKNPEAYQKFYETFSIFLKEGVTSDHEYREKIAPLLRYESSLTEDGKTTSLKDYLERMRDEQEAIYFLHAPKRSTIENGPYLEAFKARNLEVLYLFDPIDEFVMSHLGEFEGKKLLAADSADVKLEDAPAAEGETLSAEDASALSTWLKERYGDRVESVEASTRLTGSPAAALNADRFMTASMRRVLKSMNQETGAAPSVKLEINPRHALIRRLSDLKGSDSDLAGTIADQLLENSLMAAGLVEDPRELAHRLNELLERLAQK